MITPHQRQDALSALSDDELMALVASENSRALATLYDRYARIVYGLALRMLATSEHAEDIVQETFWRVWSRSATFQTRHGQFAPWLFGIARNLCIDELRRRRARPSSAIATEDTEALLTLADTQQDVERQVWEFERRRLIGMALSDLPPDQREVIELAYFGGLSQREIAEQLSSPLGTIKTRIRLGLQKLRGVLLHHGIAREDA